TVHGPVDRCGAPPVVAREHLPEHQHALATLVRAATVPHENQRLRPIDILGRPEHARHGLAIAQDIEPALLDAIATRDLAGPPDLWHACSSPLPLARTPRSR